MTKKGFTLIEMVVVVAVLLVLSSIALSTYNKSQLQTKEREAPIILRGIIQAQKTFFSEVGCYAWTSPPSGTQPGPQKQPWNGGSRAGLGRRCMGSHGAFLSFNALGFTPLSQETYFVYRCGARKTSLGWGFWCLAEGDLDGDKKLNRWVYCSQKNIMNTCEAGDYKKEMAGVF